MKKIGITGGIGTGKTFVCHILEKLGYPIFYSDQVAKKLMHENIDLINKIKQLLGNESYLNGIIDKPFIAQKIFEIPTLRNELNAIVHPEVYLAFENWCNSQTSKLVFNESALLFETESYKRFDKTILITADISIKIERIKKRDLLDEIEIKRRMNSQLSDENKLKLADFAINNNGEKLVLPQLIKCINELEEKTL
jgi:dephospho-CoA kinase